MKIIVEDDQRKQLTIEAGHWIRNQGFITFYKRDPKVSRLDMQGAWIPVLEINEKFVRAFWMEENTE